MDPTEALRQLRKAVTRYLADEDREAAQDMVEHFDALDGWLSKGGVLPNQWAGGRA